MRFGTPFDLPKRGYWLHFQIPALQIAAKPLQLATWLLLTTYRNLPTPYPTVPSPTLYGHLFTQNTGPYPQNFYYTYLPEVYVIMSYLMWENIRTNSTYYLQRTTDWTELNVLLYDGTRVLTGLLLCVWLRLTTLNKRMMMMKMTFTLAGLRTQTATVGLPWRQLGSCLANWW